MGCAPSKHLDRRVVIVGGGIAGTTVAKALDGILDVVVIDRREALVHHYSQLRAVVDPELAPRTLLPYDKLLKEGKVKHANVTAIHPDRVEIEGESDLIIREKDFLVIATGSSTAQPGHPSGTTLEEMHASHKANFAAIRGASHVVVVGGGPVGVELTGEIRDKFPDKRITMVHRGPFLCSGKAGSSSEQDVPASFGEKLGDLVRSRDIDVRLSVSVTVDGVPPKGFVTDPGTLALSDGSTIADADLVVWTTGSSPETSTFATAFADKVDAAGRLRVEPSLQVPGHPNVFALGDCAECGAAKLGYVAAKLQAPVAIKNIKALASGSKSLSRFVPGAPAMLVPHGASHGRLLFPICGGMQAGDGMTSTIKGKDLFLTDVRKDMGLQ